MHSVNSHKINGSRSNKGSLYCASRTACMTSSQRRCALEAMKFRAQETERPNAAAIHLEKERFQLKLKEIAEEKQQVE